MRRAAISLALLVAACAGEPLPPPPAPAPVAAPSPAPVAVAAPAPTLRLPPIAAPNRYALALTVTPGEPTIEGTIDIDLTLKAPSRVLWLNGNGVRVREARLSMGGREISAKVAPSGDHFLGFSFDEELPAGAAKLHVAFTSNVSDKDDRGVFLEREDGRAYVFTQFESVEARRAFPCFDEPSYKVPWEITLDVPAGDLALANTPVASERIAGARKIVRFSETRPLPSYLVAFAVGPFDLVEAGKAGKAGVPVRIVVPRGEGARAEAAAAVTPKLVARLEKLFDVGFPYEKLDVVAVPHLVSFSAMENPGLITFRARRLLTAKSERTPRSDMILASLMTHELAHHWFGDLVTTAWWDDTWLNEAFATWAETRALAPLEPSWELDLADVRDVGAAMRGDALMNARAVRQPIQSLDDIHNAFDEITYTKGAAVIAMFEAYLGPERLRRGLARYLRERAHRSATAADLLAAVSAEAGEDIAPAFSTFLDQPGVPLIHVEAVCKPEGVSLAVDQARYFHGGALGGENERWQIPICVRWGRDKGREEGRVCTLLREPSAVVPLPGVKRCPDYLVPNDGAAGYYLSARSLRDVDALLAGGKKALPPADRAALLRDLRASLTSMQHSLAMADVFARLPRLIEGAHPEIVRAAIDLAQMVPESMLEGEMRPGFARFLQKTFGARARALGWTSKPGEDVHARALRPHLLPLVADRGDDRALVREAEVLARAYLEGKSAAGEDVIDAVLAIAARGADRAMFDRLVAEAKKSKSATRRAHLLGALSMIRDPALARAARELVLGDDFDPRESTALIFGDVHTAEVTFAFIRDHFDALVAKLPEEWLGRLPRVADAFCDLSRAGEIEAFFKPRLGKLPGAPRTLAKATERVRLCGALRSANAVTLRAFLKR